METDSITHGLVVLDPVASAKGGQKNSVIVRDGQNAFWTLSTPVTPLWQPSAFKSVTGDATGRLSLCLQGDEAVMAEAQQLDTWAVEYATQHSDRLFGKTLTKDQVTDRYNGIFKKADKYPPFLKIKLGTDRNAPNFWDADKQKRDCPEDYTSCQLICRVRILGFWYMNTSFGLTCQLQDAQVTAESSVSCPF